jgi:hypothetical protein
MTTPPARPPYLLDGYQQGWKAGWAGALAWAGIAPENHKAVLAPEKAECICGHLRSSHDEDGCCELINGRLCPGPCDVVGTSLAEDRVSAIDAELAGGAS